MYVLRNCEVTVIRKKREHRR